MSKPVDYQTLKSAADAFQTRNGYAARASKILQFTGGMSVHLADVPFDRREDLFDVLTTEAARRDKCPHGGVLASLLWIVAILG